MCTGITLKSKQNNYYWGRTQEYSDENMYDAMIIPRGYDMTGLALSPYKTVHAVLGVSALHLPTLIDGINEKGLAGGTFYFANYYRYASEESIRESGKKPIRPEDLPLYILSQYETCAQIKENLNKDAAIANTPNVLGVSLPQHMVFQDEKGDSIVVEPSTEGKFDIYDNPVGVFTNSPKFDWHLTNLQNYVGLSDQPAKAITMGDLDIFTNGLGSGLRGVPGDFTPQSRFIRAAYMKHFVAQTDDDKTIAAIFHVLNSFDVPKGVVNNITETNKNFHNTQYTSAYDLKNRELSIHMYDNRRIQSVKLEEKYCTAKDYTCFKIIEEQQVHQMDEYKPEFPPELKAMIEQELAKAKG